MNLIKRSAALLLGLAMTSLPVFAGGKHADGDHHKPKYGGIVQEMKEVQYELVATPNAIAIFVEDHGKKVDVTGGSAKLTLLNGKDKSEVELKAAGGNKLETAGTFSVKHGTRVLAVVTLGGKAVSLRYTVPK